LLLLGPQPGELALQSLDPVPIFFRLAKDVGHLPLDRIEPLIERGDRRLGRRGFIGETGCIGWPAAREHLTLDLLQLALETFDALFWRRRLALGERRRGWNQDGCGNGCECRNESRFHVVGPQALVR
jgi:hypothetical protein